MRISLRFDWENKALKIARVYLLKSNVRKIVDEIFDKLYK